MLIRFLVKNLFSFKELTEFNMLPGRSTRMPHHLYDVAGISVLKLNAMYGANGAGKSNLIKAIEALQDFILEDEIPLELITQSFKFDPESKRKDIYLGIEFSMGGTPYYYGITIREGIVVEEELQISGLGIRKDRILFLRTDNVEENKLEIIFHEDLLKDSIDSSLPGFLKRNVIQRNKLVLSYFKTNPSLNLLPIFVAFQWFKSELYIISPFTKPTRQALRFEKDKDFIAFATDTMRAFKTGVLEIKVESIPVEQYFGMDNRDKAEKVTADLKANPERYGGTMTPIEEVIFVLEDGVAKAKRLIFHHEEDEGRTTFYADEESDGTRRLVDYLPPLYSAIRESKVYIIDEIERSIHPLLIKEMISKFSADEQTQGQMIFSTHESTLLDQDIFRQDEIWFAEKKADGATELYPLSEFKEHATIDIRKGYLNGRYGAIPFLANLKDLNWEHYAEA
jgi:uncharacterized protein